MLSAIVLCTIPFERFTLMLVQEDKSSLGIFLLFCFSKLSVETQKSFLPEKKKRHSGVKSRMCSSAAKGIKSLFIVF
jgi:hypothetical protein